MFSILFSILLAFVINFFLFIFLFLDYYPQVKKLKTNGSYKEAKLIENKTAKCESKVITSEIDAKDNNSKMEGEVNVTSK